MLLRIEIENFYSIRDRVSLDLRIPKTAPADRRFLDVPGFDGVRVPAVVAIFGANASGKTTVLRALSFLEAFITRSFELFKPGDDLTVQPFHNDEGFKKPTRLSFDFCPSRTVLGEELKPAIFRYSVDISHTDKRNNYVSREELYMSDDDKKFAQIFSLRRPSRDEKAKIKITDILELKRDDPRLSVRNNVSLLSSLLQFDHNFAKNVVSVIDASLISNLFYVKHDKNYNRATDFFVENPALLEKLKYRMKTIDIGIEDIKIEEIDGEKVPFFKHIGLSGNKTIYFESDGTKSFYCLFPTLSHSLELGATAIMDELDSDLHPNLVGEILQWYFRQSDNSTSAQIITSCNSASVLHLLQKEEVWIADKSLDGVSTITQLGSVHGLRRDTNLYAKYVSGQLGGVPTFG